MVKRSSRNRGGAKMASRMRRALGEQRSVTVIVLITLAAALVGGGTAAAVAFSSGGGSGTPAHRSATPPLVRAPAPAPVPAPPPPPPPTPTPPPTTTTLTPPAPAVGPQASKLITDTCLYSHEANDDPILMLGQTGELKADDFFGNTTSSATSPAPALVGGPSTCSTSDDASAYWTPMLYQNGSPITPLRNLIYWAELQATEP